MMSSTIRDDVRYFDCCLCGAIFSGYGNNPEPMTDLDGEAFDDEEECCIDCNNTKVIPFRMREMGL